jgi:hypothetical protein
VDDALLFFRSVNAKTYLGIYDTSKEEELKNDITQSKNESEAAGWIVVDIH